MPETTADGPAPAVTDVSRRRGWNKGNMANAQHGLFVQRISMGVLIPAWDNVRRICASMRKALEAAVVDARGQVNLQDAAVIQSACRWERHAQLAQLWLKQHPMMDPAELLRFSGEIARASALRDKCIEALELPTKGDLHNLKLRAAITGGITRARRASPQASTPIVIHGSQHVATGQPGGDSPIPNHPA